MSATKTLIFLAIYSLLITDTVVAFDCISITGYNLQCIRLVNNSAVISECLIPPPGVSPYELLCDGISDCPVDIDEGDQASQGGNNFNPTLLCREILI